MLERDFLRPATLNRLRSSWLAEPLERYVAWLAEQGYAASGVQQRASLVVRFGEFARAHGAARWEELPEHVEPFVRRRLTARGKFAGGREARRPAARAVRAPLHQLLRVTLPNYQGGGRGRGLPLPFVDQAPEFFAYLRDERGLQEPTLVQYDHHLRCFERFLEQEKLEMLGALDPALLSSFVTKRGRALGSKRSVQRLCSVLKIFLGYLRREELVTRDLAGCIDVPQHYRHTDVPRSISWDEVGRLLECVNRQRVIGVRDYAILLLLVTYGLRAREVAALRLDDIDWRQGRLRVPQRKAGHSSAFPLVTVVGEALVDYLERGRPSTSSRAFFLRGVAPLASMTYGAVSLVARRYLRKAGIDVPRPGSHTLRHTCAQRLLDAQVSLKEIGDYLGHRTAVATEIYTKVNIESLREIALGEGETIV